MSSPSAVKTLTHRYKTMAQAFRLYADFLTEKQRKNARICYICNALNVVLGGTNLVTAITQYNPLSGIVLATTLSASQMVLNFVAGYATYLNENYAYGDRSAKCTTAADAYQTCIDELEEALLTAAPTGDSAFLAKLIQDTTQTLAKVQATKFAVPSEFMEQAQKIVLEEMQKEQEMDHLDVPPPSPVSAIAAAAAASHSQS